MNARAGAAPRAEFRAAAVAVDWLSSMRVQLRRSLALAARRVGNIDLRSRYLFSFLADGGSDPAPNVTVTAGVGPAPTPNGGIVTSGVYQLVAETYFGTLPPIELNANIGSIGGGPVTALITVTCDTYSRTT